MHIQVDTISFTYGDSVNALHNVSFEVAAGEQVALTGHNGSGKSTLVKQLNGLLSPATGTIRIGGENIGIAKTAQLATKVALLFQHPDDQICKQTVWDEVAFGPKNLGYPKSRVKSLVEEALQLFELLPFKAKKPHDLGYSERKRITLASVVAMDTPIIIFDEPTAGLDPYEISLFITTLQKLQNENKTVIIITHDMDFVAENLYRTICLANGRKIFDGTVKDLFKRPDIMADCGLLQPQIVQLSNACKLQSPALSPYECVVELVKLQK